MYEKKRLINIQENKKVLENCGFNVRLLHLTWFNYLSFLFQSNPIMIMPKGSSAKLAHNYKYGVTPLDLKREQQAFQAGEGVSFILKINYVFFQLHACL